MKKKLLSLVLFVLGIVTCFSQSVESYKNKTAHNQTERAKILEAMRKEGLKTRKTEFYI